MSHSTSEEQPYIKSGETTFTVKEEVEAKIQDGGNKTLSISILQLNKLHVLLCFLKTLVAGKCIMVCKEYILLFRLIIYVLYSFTRTFSTFNIGLPLAVGWVNLLFTILGARITRPALVEGATQAGY